MPEVLTALGMLVLFVLVLALAYLATKWIGKRYGGRIGGSSGNIKILDRAALGPDRSLYIVEAAGKTLLIGATQQRIETLCELDPEALPPPAQEEPSAFASTLKSVLKDGWGVGGGKRRDGD